MDKNEKNIVEKFRALAESLNGYETVHLYNLISLVRGPDETWTSETSLHLKDYSRSIHEKLFGKAVIPGDNKPQYDKSDRENARQDARTKHTHQHYLDHVDIALNTLTEIGDALDAN